VSRRVRARRLLERELGRLADCPVQAVLLDQACALALRVEQACQIQVLTNRGRGQKVVELVIECLAHESDDCVGGGVLVRARLEVLSGVGVQ